MGQAKNRGSQKERMELAVRRKQAVNDRMVLFVQEVKRFSKKTGLDLGAVKLDARFVIMKFDELVAFVDHMSMTDAEVLEDLKPRETGEEGPAVTPIYSGLVAVEEPGIIENEADLERELNKIKEHDKSISNLGHEYQPARSMMKDPSHENADSEPSSHE